MDKIKLLEYIEKVLNVLLGVYVSSVYNGEVYDDNDIFYYSLKEVHSNLKAQIVDYKRISYLER